MKKTSDAIGFFGGSKPVACPHCGKTVNMQMLRSSNGIGVFGIPEMNRFYRHVLIEGGYPHHGAVAFAHIGKTLLAVLRYLGVTEIGYNRPASERYPAEIVFG